MFVVSTVLSLLLFTAGLLFCLCHFKKHSANRSRRFALLLWLSMIINLCYVVTLVSPNEMVARITYCICAALIALLMYGILHYAIIYTGTDKKWTYWTLGLFGLIMLDMISVISNAFTEHAFTFMYVNLNNGEFILSYQSHLLHDIHDAICIFTAILGVVVVAKKSFTSNKFSRLRNMSLLTTISVLFLGEWLFLLSDTHLDLTPMIVSMMMLSVYYFTVVFIPRELLNQSLSKVSEEMNEYLFVFDENNQCVYINKSAKKFLSKIDYNESKATAGIAEWLATDEANGKTDITSECYSIKGSEKTYLFRFSYHRFVDDSTRLPADQRYMGCFLMLQDRTEEIERNERDRYAASHDLLTGLHNQTAFESITMERLHNDPGSLYMILCFDIKEFKLLNDLFGRDAGNKLLKDLANALLDMCGSSSIVGRINNDRFAVCLKKSAYSESELLVMLEDLSVLNENKNYLVHIYMGAYVIEDPCISVNVMLNCCYRAIATIKGSYQRIAYYDASLREKAAEEQQLVSELPIAMKHRDIVIYLQPQVDAQGTALGAEVLVRWQHPDRGLLPPGAFIPLFEQNSMISQLDQYVWEVACETLARWTQNGWTDGYLSINISPVDIYLIDVCEVLVSLVKKYGISSNRLKLEITETAIAKSMDVHKHLIDQLQAAGFIVEMDDFGSGYSSLNMLKEINVDLIKLDMAFLRKTRNPHRAQTIIRSVVDLTAQLGIPMISEGVETTENLAFLKHVGCTAFQGYLFDPPMSVAEFEAKYLPFSPQNIALLNEPIRAAYTVCPATP